MQQPGREGMRSSIDFSCSDPKLTQAFQWAKEQALAYAFEGDPVGKWYEAALPGREAFCMRDTAHQATGAHFLGLAEHTYNMLYKFAVNISPSRDWCSFWEIDRHDRPAPVDYTDDTDFWYNLPANFDVLDCCYRQYCWTGDRRYLEDPAVSGVLRPNRRRLRARVGPGRRRISRVVSRVRHGAGSPRTTNRT